MRSRRRPSMVGPSRYRLCEMLGEGAMGVVYRAICEDDGREVALKYLKSSLLAEDEKGDERFSRELQVSCRLRHPHIVEILEVGSHEDRPFLAMALLRGRTLDRIQRERGGVVPVGLLVPVLAQVLSALEYIHDKDLLHRDLKPANIMVAEDGHATLMDFGLVKDLNRTALTGTGYLVGSPSYIAPEVITGSEASWSADLFSLGTVTYECLTGSKPFRGDNLEDLLNKIISAEPVSMTQLHPECPPSLAHFVATCHRKDPSQRFSSTREAREFMEVVGVGLNASLVPAESGDALPGIGTAGTTSPGFEVPRRTSGTGAGSGPGASVAGGGPPAPRREGPRPDVTRPVRRPSSPVRARRTSRWRRAVSWLGSVTLVTSVLGAYLVLDALVFAPAAARIDPGSLRLVDGFDRIEASWPASAAVSHRIRLRAVSGPATALETAPAAIGAGRVARFTGLVPETVYRLEIVDPAGSVLLRGTARTRPLRELAERLGRSVDRFDVSRRLVALARADATDRDRTMSLGAAIRRDLANMEISGMLRALEQVAGPARAEVGGDPGGRGSFRRALGSLSDLELACRSAGLGPTLPHDPLDILVTGLTSEPSLIRGVRQRVVFRDSLEKMGRGKLEGRLVPSSFDGRLTGGGGARVLGGLVDTGPVLGHTMQPLADFPPVTSMTSLEIGVSFEGSTPGTRIAVLAVGPGPQPVPLMTFRVPARRVSTTLYQRIPVTRLPNPLGTLAVELIPNPVLGPGEDVLLHWIDLRAE